MVVRRISTLGCHPLLLLAKLAAAEGLTILKEEKNTVGGVDYRYRIIARIAENLYIEAYDAVYKVGTEDAYLPKLLVHGSDAANLPLEAAQSHKTISNASNSRHIGISTSVTVESTALSMLVSCSNDTSISADSISPEGTSLVGRYNPHDADGIMAPEASFPSDLSFGTWQGQLVVCLGATKKSAPYPFAIFTSNIIGGVVSGGPVESGYNMLAYCSGYTSSGDVQPAPIMIAGTKFRVATSVLDNELVSPSSWFPLPIFATLYSTGDGLYFVNGPDSRFGGLLAVTKVDTTVGSGMSGVFPVIYKTYKYTLPLGDQSGEMAYVLGSEVNPTETSAMSIYAPAPPIASDSVKGGPVVSDLFVYSLSEIRGAIMGALAAPSSAALGTSGWLDGKRFSVQFPGRMIQVG